MRSLTRSGNETATDPALADTAEGSGLPDRVPSVGETIKHYEIIRRLVHRPRSSFQDPRMVFRMTLSGCRRSALTWGPLL